MSTRKQWLIAALTVAVVAAPVAHAKPVRPAHASAVSRPSPQATLAAVERTAPSQVGLAWQYLRDIGALA